MTIPHEADIINNFDLEIGDLNKITVELVLNDIITDSRKCILIHLCPYNYVKLKVTFVEEPFDVEFLYWSYILKHIPCKEYIKDGLVYKDGLITLENS